MIRTAATGFALATALTGLGAVMSPASATDTGTEHCPDHSSPDVTKVELDYETTSLDLTLPEGSWICVKAGTEAQMVQLGPGGTYTQDFAFNKKCKALAISYYVIYKKPCPTY